MIGGWVEQDRLRQIMFDREPACNELETYSCYFVDDGGFLILSNTEDDAYKVRIETRACLLCMLSMGVV